MIKQVIAALLLTTSVAVAAPTLTASVIDDPAFSPHNPTAVDTYRTISTRITGVTMVDGGSCNVHFDAVDTDFVESLTVAGACATTTWQEAYDEWSTAYILRHLDGVDLESTLLPFGSTIVEDSISLPLMAEEPLEGIVDGVLPDGYMPISGDDLLAELRFQGVPDSELVGLDTPETITPAWNRLYDPDIPEYASLVGVRAYFEDEGAAVIHSQYDDTYVGSLAAYQDGVDNYYYPAARITRIEFDRLWAEGADDRTAVIATYLNANGGWLNGETGDGRMERLWEEVNNPDTSTTRLEDIARIVRSEDEDYLSSERRRIAARAFAIISERAPELILEVAPAYNPAGIYDILCNPRNRDIIEDTPTRPGSTEDIYRLLLVDHIAGAADGGWPECPDGRDSL